jgi:glutamate formiminotransferase/formiminotetrahydrofolate cyclodeaminase
MQTGEMQRVPGMLKNVKAIGWYIKDYDTTQVSMNITDFRKAPLHVIFETIKERAAHLNTRVTGCELIGLLPSEALIEAGRFYAREEGKEVNREALIDIAIDTLNLNSIKPFDKRKNIIEYAAGIEIM